MRGAARVWLLVRALVFFCARVDAGEGVGAGAGVGLDVGSHCLGILRRRRRERRRGSGRWHGRVIGRRRVLSLCEALRSTCAGVCSRDSLV